MIKKLDSKIKNIEKMNEEKLEEVMNKITWHDTRNEKRTENIIKAMGIAHNRTDLKIEDLENLAQENLTNGIKNKDKIEKNSQMISELINVKDDKIMHANDDNDKIIEDVPEKCCQIDLKVNQNNQILRENK